MVITKDKNGSVNGNGDNKLANVERSKPWADAPPILSEYLTDSTSYFYIRL